MLLLQIGRASCRERGVFAGGGEAEDGIRDRNVTGVQTCALPICIIHDPATKTLLKKRWSSPAWITCLCEFRGWRRPVMGGRSWTELFFLDEATAFAAGHRPCFFCRSEERRVGKGGCSRVVVKQKTAYEIET